MDTALSLSFYQTREESYDPDSLLDESFLFIEDFNKKISSYAEDESENGTVLSLNQRAGEGWVSLSPETMELLLFAQREYFLTEERLNIMLGPLIREWAIGTENEHLPSPEAVKKALSFSQFSDLVLDEENGRAQLKQRENLIDTGAIGKSFIADNLSDWLKERGVKNAILDFGGNLVLWGSKGGAPFRIGIQTPYPNPEESYIAILSLTGDKRVSTSGNYQRFFVEEGVRYHHIFDPKNGYPTENSLLSVTVLAPSSIESDALATALYIYGKSTPPPWLPAGVDLLIAEREGELINLYVSEAIFPYVEVTSDEVTLIPLESNLE